MIEGAPSTNPRTIQKKASTTTTTTRRPGGHVLHKDMSQKSLASVASSHKGGNPTSTRSTAQNTNKNTKIIVRIEDSD
jgi:hypothetical protein